MKRRSFLVRSVILPISALLFGASGWLMGARNLGMPAEAPTPPPGSGLTTWDGTCACNRASPANACYCQFYCRNFVQYDDCWYGCFSTGCINAPWCAYSATPTGQSC